MALPGNGIFVVRGEMTTLMTAMKRGVRWSHSYQDEETDHLLKALQDLKLILNKVEDLKVVDPVVFISPFLEVIRSEDITGPVTSLALMAINKFLSYGLLDPAHHNTPVVVDNIADSVTHAKFVGTDQSSDAVVLMKILQVLRALTLSPEGILLTNDSLCEIMLACFRICFETRLSELLRKTAELYLKDMVQLVFMRLPQFTEDSRLNSMKHLKMRPGVMEQSRTRRKSKVSNKNKKVTNTNNIPSTTEKINDDLIAVQNNSSLNNTPVSEENIKNNIVDMQGSISQAEKVNLDSNVNKQFNGESKTVNEETTGKIQEETCKNENMKALPNQEPNETEVGEELSKLDSSQSTTSTIPMEEENKEDYVNRRGIRFTPLTEESSVLVPYGLACVKEMFRFLISLCNPLDKQNTDTMIHLGLSLLTVAFEVSADNIGKYASLLALVKNNLCRNLISLLLTDRISIFAVNLQVSFLIFESLRTHLKFQLELYLTKLIDMVTSDAAKVTYEHRELALDYIVQLWRIPGFVTELYVNYDCSMYCSNLFENLTKILAKNAFSTATSVYNTHLLSLDALLTVIENIEINCIEATKHQFERTECASATKQDGDVDMTISDFLRKASTRQRVSDNVPSKEELMKIKNIKKWLPQGNEYFNHKPKKGIQFFQEHGVLKAEFDPKEVVNFLRENRSLDKAKIGEYISSRNNLQILEAYVKMFDFKGTRIDEALRMYLETFRLPGEAPLISLVLEHFAEHWHKCNGEPFANADAAFTLAYAVIMLNVDQHNNNVKRQNNPMTCEEFKKNLKGVNGGSDFDQGMLDEIYNAIKNEEIVMPAEHTGIVKENYLWKVLLRRGLTKEGTYYLTSSDIFDDNIFCLIWGPIVSALSFVYGKAEEEAVYRRALNGFESCASISSHFGITKNVDMLVLTLCKFTGLHNQQQKVSAVAFGASAKAQTAFKAVFALVHQYGDNVREGWSHILGLILSLYNANLVPKSFLEVEDFTAPEGKITLVCEPMQMQKQDSNIFSSLYSYMVASASSENLSKSRTAEEIQAEKCIEQCNLDQLVIDSKFLHEEALLELIRALIGLSRPPDVEKSFGYAYNEHVNVFFLELMLKVVTQNRDRVMSIWNLVRDHLYTLMMNASHFDYQFLLERSVIGLLRLAIRLMRNEEMSPVVVQSLRMLLLLKSSIIFKISVEISCGLYELLKTSAQNIHTNTDWSIIFTLLECVGAGAQPPKPVVNETQSDQALETKSEGGVSEDEVASSDKGYTSDSELITHVSKTSSRCQSPMSVSLQSDSASPVSPVNITPTNPGGWILVGAEGDVQPVIGRNPPADQYNLALECNLGPHRPKALLKCCESLAFLVRDVAHITPYNFDNCIHCVRTFVEASVNGGKRNKTSSERESRPRRKAGTRRNDHRKSPATSSPDEDDSDDEFIPNGYHQISIQLLDLMHTIHTRTAQIFRWWAEEGGETAQGTSLWSQGWCPLLQGIARLCSDNRRQVRMSAITYLQRALLVHDLQTLNGAEWEACFHRVLFPLLNLLLEPIGPKDPHFLEETRMRAATLLSKVFLHHLTPLLSLPTFTNLWLHILDLMDRYMHADKSDLLYEAIPESLKNMLLVMESAKVFEGRDADGGKDQLWFITWERISKFLPNLKEELFYEQEQRQLSAETDKKNEFIPSVDIPPQTITTMMQHNVQNATRSSIILQPPSAGNNVASSLFSHLGQMVSTPIVAKPDKAVEETIHPPTNPESKQLPLQNCLVYSSASDETPHVFPVLYSRPPVSEVSSLYGDFVRDPYNSIISMDQQQTKVTDKEETTCFKQGSEGNREFEGGSASQPPTFNMLANYFGSSDSGVNFVFPGSEVLFDSRPGETEEAKTVINSRENQFPDNNVQVRID